MSNKRHTVRVSAAQFFSGKDTVANLELCKKYMRQAKSVGADLIVMPENSNRERDYFADGKPSRKLAWERCEFVDGPFIQGICEESKRLGIYTSVGADLRRKGGEKDHVVNICAVLCGPEGTVIGVHNKHILWDYEYTLFAAGNEPYQVFDTPIGKLGLLLCADGILMDTPRCLALLGAEVLVNSLNSRGPDEKRLHIPCRSIENGVWHVASNTVGNPNNEGLLWPWTGGSQVVAPDGTKLAEASEEHEELVWADITPSTANIKNKLGVGIADLFKVRRPELYQILGTPVKDTPVAKLGMLGPSPPEMRDEVKFAMMQLSRTHTAKYIKWAAARQIKYAAVRGAAGGCLPELFCFKVEEVATNPAAAAKTSKEVLAFLQNSVKENGIFLGCTLVEEGAPGTYYHTAYLLGPDGSVVGTYRKAHLSRSELIWATPGDALSAIFDTSKAPGAKGNGIGKVAFMIGDECWIPEVSKCLGLQGVENILHPCNWGRKEGPHLACVERVSEARSHIVSVTRMDNAAGEGSQCCWAGEFTNTEPIPLMRYPQAVWMRHGVEEQLMVTLERRQAWNKMMGFNLDVLEKGQPECYAPMTNTKNAKM